MAETLAVVTGASTGVGYELARRAAEDGHALFVCADEPRIEEAADRLRRLGAEVETMQVDLSSRAGVDALWDRLKDRRIDLFFANAGRALGRAFPDQRWEDVKELIDLNVLQTTAMLHRVGGKMRDRGAGRILVTGSIGGYVPGPFDAVYNATKAYLDSLCYALQDEWRDNGVTLTCLLPGPLDTPIFHRPENRLSDTPIGRSGNKGDPADAARRGYEALMAGERGAIPSARSRLVTMLSGVVPDTVLARLHRAGAEPERR